MQTQAPLTPNLNSFIFYFYSFGARPTACTSLGARDQPAHSSDNAGSWTHRIRGNFWFVSLKGAHPSGVARFVLGGEWGVGWGLEILSGRRYLQAGPWGMNGIFKGQGSDVSKVLGRYLVLIYELSEWGRKINQDERSPKPPSQAVNPCSSSDLLF